MVDGTPNKPALPKSGEPDPSVLATAALTREVAYLRDLLDTQATSEQRLSGALREADEKFEAERDRRLTEVKNESDRRLTEVATEREKALKIKEEADKEALRLDREIRQFKDDKAGLRTDSAVSNIEARLRPIDSYMATQQGQEQGSDRSKNRSDITFGQIATIVTIIITAAAIIIALKP
jgi:hypothetical protein